MKNILIYGDSNAWGLIPTTKFDRFSFDERWPGILQQTLGDDVHIIEENLCARTIDSDDPRPGFEGRNGITELPMCLDSHYPLDMVILTLGLNELKSIYDWTPAQVAQKMEKMIQTVQSRRPNFHDHNTQVVLMTQPVVEHTGQWGDLWVGAHDKSIELRDEYIKLAQKTHVQLIDPHTVNPDVRDGVHFDTAGHRAVADAVAYFIRNN